MPSLSRPRRRPGKTVREEAFATSDIGPLSPAHFLFPSRIVSLDPEIRDYVRQSFTPGRAVLEAAIELIGRMKADIVYEIGATTVTTTPPMSFALRRGVCQDFAHIMISGLRGIGLPAAYVSGYLRSAPRTDPTRLQGADAMHAWVLLWCGAESKAGAGSGSIPPMRILAARGSRHAGDRPRLHRRRADGRRDPGLGRPTHRRCRRRHAGRLIAAAIVRCRPRFLPARPAPQQGGSSPR